jgi:hypothetical protein
LTVWRGDFRVRDQGLRLHAAGARRRPGCMRRAFVAPRRLPARRDRGGHGCRHSDGRVDVGRRGPGRSPEPHGGRQERRRGLRRAHGGSVDVLSSELEPRWHSVPTSTRPRWRSAGVARGNRRRRDRAGRRLPVEAHHRVEFETEASLRLRLGDVVAWLNRTAQRRVGSLLRFGLLGYPARVIGSRDPDDPNPSTPTGPADGTLVLGLPPADWVALDRLARWTDAVLPRLSLLSWLDTDIDIDEPCAADLRQRIRRAASSQFSPPAEPTDPRGGWSHTDIPLSAFRQISAQPLNCPSCRRNRPVLLRLRLRPVLRAACRVEPGPGPRSQGTPCRRVGA